MFREFEQHNRAKRVIRAGGGPTYDLARKLTLVIYKILRIQHDSDGTEIDVVEIGLQRQALKRAPPFAGRDDSAVSPFIGRFRLQIRITAQIRGNGFPGSWTLRIR